MTKRNALELAIATLSTDNANTEAVETLTKMLEQIENRKPMTDEKKAELNAKRKEATTTARKELIEKVAPVLRKYLTAPITAKELYETAKAELPADFSWQKVQNVLIRELAPELDKAEALFNEAVTLGSVEAAKNLEEISKKRKDNALYGE